MIINNTILQAISWTLIHSVWQGFLLALLAGVIILLTKKSSSALRYNLFAGLFIAFIVVAGITFRYEFYKEQAAALPMLHVPLQTISATGETTFLLANGNILDTVVTFLDHNANSIVMLWFLIFCIKCFGMFKGLSHIYRIRNYKTQQPPAYWSLRIKELCKSIHLKQNISLLESRLVKMPSVAGFFKPVILLPVGLLSNLPQDQIEAILLHELAHIRRKDYGINIIQSFAEIVFFFNPGILWLSSLLKDERENCCDDIAIAVTASKSKFIHALVSFEEYQLKTEQLAIGFGGHKNHLLNRARRIISNHNKSLNTVEKTFLSFSLIVMVIMMLACNHSKPTPVAHTGIVTERHPNPETMSIEKKEAEKISKAAAMTSVQTDGISPEIQKNNQPVSQSPAMPEALPKPAKKTTTTTTSSSQTDFSSVTTDDNGNTETYSTTSRTGISGEDLPVDINTNELTKNIISYLLAENIISTTKNLSYKLSNKELIVNGFTQSERDFRKLKDKYVKAKNYTISYNYKASDTPDAGK